MMNAYFLTDIRSRSYAVANWRGGWRATLPWTAMERWLVLGSVVALALGLRSYIRFWPKAR